MTDPGAATAVAEPAADAPALAVEDLTVQFALPAGRLTAVDGVGYALTAGRTLGVVGESGSGKSVTALALLGLLPPTAGVTRGRALWQGRDLLRLRPRDWPAIRGRHVALVAQDPMSALNPAMTVGDQVAEALRLHGRVGRRDARDGAVRWLGRVGLPDPPRQARFYPHELSGGMRQRATIAMALAGGPEILIADEPTTALDVTVQARILDLLLDLQAELGLALQLVSHNLAVVSEVADDVLVMYAGRVVERGPAAALLAAPRHPYTRALLAAVPRPGRRAAPEPIGGSPPDPFHPAPTCAFLARCPVAGIRCHVERPGLERIGDGHDVACFRPWEAPA